MMMFGLGVKMMQNIKMGKSTRHDGMHIGAEAVVIQDDLVDILRRATVRCV